VPIDVGWVARSTTLRSLTLLGFIATDRSWEAIKSSELEVLSASVAPTVDLGALYDELMGALPGAWIQLYPAVAWQGRVVELQDGSFEVGYDLAGRWDLPTTQAALGRLSALVAEREPFLVGALRVDAEGSAVHLASPSRRAIERVVALIERATPSGPS
jgi:hypothetical protein